jgi:parvulin-like peptidyl-prolyl isomerase
MKKLLSVLIPVVLLMLFLAYCGTKEETVATVGNMDITKSQFIKEMVRYHGEKPNYQDVDLERKKTILNNMIKRNLKLLEAYDLDLDHDKEIVNSIDTYRKRLIINKYYEKVIVEQVVPSKVIDEYMQRQGVEMRTSQILIGFKESNPNIERTKEAAKLLAEQVAQQVKSGADFTALAIKYSDEPGVENTKGSTKYFKWGERPYGYQEAAWKLNTGEISAPVETRYGYFIIRADDRREIPDFKPNISKENIANIKRSLFQAKGDSGNLVANKHLADLREKYQAVTDTVAIKEITGLLTDKMKNEVVTVESFTPQQKKIVLARWKGGSTTWGSLLNLYGDRLSRIIGRFRQENVLKQEVESTTNMELVVQNADKYDIPDDPDIDKQLATFLEDRLIQLVEKKEVEDKVTVTDDEMLKYYESNPNRFTKNEELEIWQIYVKDEKLAKTIAAKVRAGSDFGALAKKYSEDRSSNNKGGYVGFRSAASLGTVGQEAFRLGPNKTGGPVKFHSGWTIFKTGKKNDKMLRPFKDVENQVRSLLRTDTIKANRVEWEQKLEKKYKPVIKEDVLKQM